MRGNLIALTLTLVITVCTAASAQFKTVIGKVVSEEFEPLNGAIVQTIDSSYTTSTDAQGNFVIEVPDTTTEVIVWYVGLETTKVPVNQNCHVNILMLSNISIDFGTEAHIKRRYRKEERRAKALTKKAYKEGVFEEEKPCS